MSMHMEPQPRQQASAGLWTPLLAGLRLAPPACIVYMLEPGSASSKRNVAKGPPPWLLRVSPLGPAAQGWGPRYPAGRGMGSGWQEW